MRITGRERRGSATLPIFQLLNSRIAFPDVTENDKDGKECERWPERRVESISHRLPRHLVDPRVKILDSRFVSLSQVSLTPIGVMRTTNKTRRVMRTTRRTSRGRREDGVSIAR
jgi:hypothetical protein